MTGLRSIDGGMDAAIVTEIDARLDAIARDEGVALPLVIESGSRAWGFPSPDSDYDCRFIFARPPRRTFSLVPERDVIERDVTAIFDIGGWELSKSLHLLMHGNAVVVEWLQSPIVYRGDEAFRAEYLDLARKIVRRENMQRHYARMAYAMRARVRASAGPDGAFPLKKLFYVLRPLMATLWLDTHPEKAVAPMHFPTLMEAVDLPSPVRGHIDALLEAKAITRELGSGSVPAPVIEWMEPALDAAHKGSRVTPHRDDIDLADSFHQRWLTRLFPDQPLG